MSTPNPIVLPPNPGTPPPAPPAQPPAQPPAAPAPAPAAPALNRPDGITDEEWNALSDPGKAALVRERDARSAAERQLAAYRQTQPTPPAQPPAEPPAPAAPVVDPSAPMNADAIAAIVQQSVAAALKPIQDAEAARTAAAAQQALTLAVTEASRPKFLDPSDVLADIGANQVALVDDTGTPDHSKITAALDDLAKRKPHLLKPGQRQAPAGLGAGAPTPSNQEGERVNESLKRMQAATGARRSGVS